LHVVLYLVQLVFPILLTVFERWEDSYSFGYFKVGF